MRFVCRMKILLAFLLGAFVTVALAEPRGTVKDVTPDEAALLLKSDMKPLVLDVRTPDEFAAGHIPGATNVDFLEDNFEKRVAALDATGPVILHCAAGNRSSQALKKIIALKKFGAIYHLKSGFNGWKAAGKPLEKEPAAK